MTDVDVATTLKCIAERCAGNQTAAAERNAKQSLYLRLGGKEKIRAMLEEMMRHHFRNDALYDLLKHFTPSVLVDKLVPYLVEHTGGPAVYTGSTLAASHRHLRITNAQFLAGGGDIQLAMEHFGYAQTEIDDVMCLIFQLRDQVVFE